MKFLTWANAQFEWLKSFFEKDKPTEMKFAIEFLMAFVFMVAFAKKVKHMDSIPDLPGNWLILFCLILGLNGINMAVATISKIRGGDNGDTTH